MSGNGGRTHASSRTPVLPEAVENLDFSAIKRKLMDPTEGKDFSLDQLKDGLRLLHGCA
jgi:hypothetical protein